MIMGIRAAGWTEVGCVRKHNEDSFLSDPDLGLFIVADGLGGHAAGEVASQIVVETVARFVGETLEKDRTWPVEYDPSISYDGNRLKVALLLSHQAIAEDIRRNPERETMGSTVVAGLFHGPKVTLAHVGDSRAYVLGPEGIRQVTRDHSWVADILERSNDIQHAVESLISAAREHGGEDNITAVLVGWEPEEA